MQKFWQKLWRPKKRDRMFFFHITHEKCENAPITRWLRICVWVKLGRVASFSKSFLFQMSREDCVFKFLRGFSKTLFKPEEWIWKQQLWVSLWTVNPWGDSQSLCINIIINYCHRPLILFSLKFPKFIPIIQGLVQNSLIIFQKQEQIMVYSISDFKVLQYGIPSMKISNYLHCLCLKRKWNSTSSKITRHLYIVWVTLKWK